MTALAGRDAPPRMSAAISTALTNLPARTGFCATSLRCACVKPPMRNREFSRRLDPLHGCRRPRPGRQSRAACGPELFPAIKRVIGHDGPRCRVGKANGPGLRPFPMTGSRAHHGEPGWALRRTKVGLALLWHIQVCPKSQQPISMSAPCSHPTPPHRLPLQTSAAQIVSASFARASG